jgi:copper chaperone CopZ
MLKNIFSIVIVALLLSIPTFAKDIQKADLSVTMECNGCKNKVEKTLNNTKGVKKVNINLKDQSVKVEYDKDVVTEEQLVSVLNAADSKLSAKSANAKPACQSQADAKQGCSKAKSCQKSCQQKNTDADTKPKK